jgi:hypothetical protein
MTASADVDAAARAAPARLPDFFIVGHSKSGTTALYEMLRRHPQIFMPELKEPLFFAEDLRSRFQNPRGGRLPQTLEEYLPLFAPAREDQLVGEATSSYLWSQTAAANIAAARPDARIIAIFREPASFLRSFHLQLVQNHIETEKDFATAIALVDRRRAGEAIPPGSHRPQALMYTDHVRYAEQIGRFQAEFPPEQILTLIYEDYRSDNEGTVRRVLRFLGVDETPPVEPIDANPTVLLRSHRLDDLLRSVSVGRGPAARMAKGAIKTVLPRNLRRGALRATRERVVIAEPPAPDESTMLELRRRFRPEVEALGQVLDRDLIKLWGYEGIG